MHPEKMLVAALIQGADGILDMIETTDLRAENIFDPTARELFSHCIQAHKLGELSATAVRALISASTGDHQHKTSLHNTLNQLEKMQLPEDQFTMNFFRSKKRETEGRALLKQAVDEVWSAKDFDTAIKKLKDGIDHLAVDEKGVEVLQYRKTVIARDQARITKIENDPGLQFIDNLAYFQKYFPFGIQKQTLTAITAPTNLGKSIFLANMIRMAVMPGNRCVVLYVFSENRAEEATARLDSVLLNKEYLSLYRNHLTSDEMLSLTGDELSDIFYCRLQLDKFSAVDIREAIAKINRENKVKVDYVFVDSPDHMTGSTERDDYYLDKTQAWIDLKVLAEDLDVGIIGTRPMDEKFRVSKKKGEIEKLTASSGANGQKITRLLDAEIAFHVDDLETGTANHRIVTVTKLRDGGTVDNERVRLMITNTLRFIHEDDFSKLFGSKETPADDLFSE